MDQDREENADKNQPEEAKDNESIKSSKSTTSDGKKHSFKKATAQLKAEAIRRYKLKHLNSVNNSEQQGSENDQRPSSSMSDGLLTEFETGDEQHKNTILETKSLSNSASNLERLREFSNKNNMKNEESDKPFKKELKNDITDKDNDLGPEKKEIERERTPVDDSTIAKDVPNPHEHNTNEDKANNGNVTEKVDEIEKDINEVEKSKKDDEVKNVEEIKNEVGDVIENLDDNDKKPSEDSKIIDEENIKKDDENEKESGEVQSGLKNDKEKNEEDELKAEIDTEKPIIKEDSDEKDIKTDEVVKELGDEINDKTEENKIENDDAETKPKDDNVEAKADDDQLKNDEVVTETNKEEVLPTTNENKGNEKKDETVVAETKNEIDNEAEDVKVVKDNLDKLTTHKKRKRIRRRKVLPTDDSQEPKQDHDDMDDIENDDLWESVSVTDNEEQEKSSSGVDGMDPNTRGDEDDIYSEVLSHAPEKDANGEITPEEVIPDDFYYEMDEYINKAFVSENSGLPIDMLKLHHSFGYDSRKRSNLNLLDDNHLIWVAGNLVEIFDIGKNELQYIRSTSGGGIGHITVNPEKTHIAVAEKGSTPRIIIYEYPSLKLARILRGGTEQGYAYVEFNPDGKLLASVGGDPDYMLTLWDWKNERIVLRSKAFSQDVFRVSFNSELQGQLTSAGTGHIRFWRMAKTFTGLKLQGQLGKFGKTEISDVEGYVELPDGKVLSGCEWGNMLLWDGGLIKVEICRKNKKHCHTGPIQQIIMDEGELITAGLDGYVRVWNFETIDTADVSDETAIFEMDPMNELKVGNDVQLKHLVKTVSDDDTTIWFAQDSNGGIWKLDLSFSFTAVAPEKIASFHAGEINCVSTSPVSHLVATTGSDKSVRIMDYLSRKQLCESRYTMGGHSILWLPKTVDPKGSLVAAGFSDGVVRLFVFQQKETVDIHGRKNKDQNELALKQVFKPHTSAVTVIAVDSTGDIFATGGADCSVFFMGIGETFKAIGFVRTPAPVTYMQWSPSIFTSNTLLVCCSDGNILEFAAPIGNYDTSKTYEIHNLPTRNFKFTSIKSRLRHNEELQKQRELEEAELKKEEEDRRLRIERGLEDEEVDEEAEEEKRKEKEEKERLKREEEEAWEPYIPKESSPVLFGSYSTQENEFWLSMGSYDAGYLYKCKFYDDYEKSKMDQDDINKPIHSIPVKDSDDTPLTIMKCNENGKQLFVGMENGAVRIYTISGDDLDIGQIEDHWQLSMHDNWYGSITNLDFSYDGHFLFTVGKDGNFFSYEVMDVETVEKSVLENRAKIPSAKLSEDKLAVDINDTNAYSIEDAKQKAEYDKMIALAEQKKDAVRITINSLREKFRSLIESNEKLPQHLQLSRGEFEMDPEIKRELHKQTEEKIELVNKEMAWEVEKHRLALEKLNMKFKDEIYCERIVVKAFRTTHNISTIRTAKLSEEFQVIKDEIERLKTVTMDMTHENTMRDKLIDSEDIDKETGEGTQTDLEKKGLLGPTTLTGSVGERIMKQLARVDEKRKKRAERKAEWEELFDNKPSDDWEDPEDVAAIKYARENMGDFKLKSSADYTVPAHLRTTALKARGKLLQLRQVTFDHLKKFNDSVLKLREKKISTIEKIETLTEQLTDIQQHLTDDEKKPIPEIPTMDDDEMPERKYEYDEDRLMKFKVELEERAKNAGKPTEGAGAAMAAGFTSMPAPKPKRAKIPQIPKREMTRTTTKSDRETITPNDFYLDIDDGECELTPLEKELLEIKKIKWIYEQRHILEEINELVTNFDAKLRTLRHDKFQLDVVLKNADLRLLTLFQELQLLKEFEKQENFLADKVDQRNIEKVDMQGKILDCQNRLTKKKKDLENLTDKEKQLTLTFQQSLGENNKFIDYLTKVFKKKIRRKKLKAKDGDGESEEDSDDDSDDSDLEESDEDDESEGGGFDLDVCPPQCDQTVYDNTCTLREKRLDLEEETLEEKKNMEAFKKELETLQKKLKVIEQGLKTAEDELEAFQQEKQRKINEFNVVVTLKLHQVQHHINTTIPTDLSPCLIFERMGVVRLQQRIKELEQEKQVQKRQQRDAKHHHKELIKERKVSERRINDLEEECDKRMIAKFGKAVDMERLEQVTVNRNIEELKEKLRLAEGSCADDLTTWDDRIQEAKDEIIDAIKKNTDRLDQMNMLRDEKRQFENGLDFRQKHMGGGMSKGVGSRMEDDKERHRLVQLVQMQAQEVHALKQEISLLCHKGGHVLPPPANGRGQNSAGNDLNFS